MKIGKILKEGWLDFKRRRQLRNLEKQIMAREKVYQGKLTILGRRAWENGTQSTASGQEEIAALNLEERSCQEKIIAMEHDKAELEKQRKAEEERLSVLISEVETEKKPLDSELNSIKKETDSVNRELSDKEQKLAGFVSAEDQLAEQVQASPDKPELQNEAAAKIAANAEEKKKLAAEIEDLRQRERNLQARTIPLERKSGEFQGTLDRLISEKKEKTSSLNSKIGELAKEIKEISVQRDDLRRRMSELFAKLGQEIAESGTSDESLSAEMESCQATALEIKSLEEEKSSLLRIGEESGGNSLFKAIFLMLIFLIAAAGLIYLLIRLLS